MKPNGVKSFRDAEEKASEYIDSKERVGELLAQGSEKAQGNYEFLVAPWESLQIVLRLIRSWLSGKYAPPMFTLLGALGALIYFIDPLDLIPDSVPVLGYLDDATVIAVFMRLNLTEISRFRNWESKNAEAQN